MWMNKKSLCLVSGSLGKMSPVGILSEALSSTIQIKDLKWQERIVMLSRK